MHIEAGARGRRRLIEEHARGERPAASWVVGAEYEKIGLTRGRPLHYEEDGGPSIRGLLRRLEGHLGWRPILDAGHIIGLTGEGGASITLEPGGQFELSGATHRTVHELVGEMDDHAKALADVEADLPIRWMWAGHQPVHGPEDLVWMPKQRYAIMRRYLPTRGALALHMMQRTCTVQSNLDYSDEADQGRKLRLAMAVGPLTTAMFANSPYSQGKLTGYKSFRAHIWTDVDPDRTGMPAWVFDGEPPTYERYVDYALKVPMFFIVRDGVYLDCAGRSFEQFIAQGCDGHQATLDDWRLHLSTIFTEARLKTYIELRAADCVRPSLLPALPALSRGLLYHRGALDAVWDLLKGWSYEARLQHREDVTRDALDARTPDGHRTRDVALEVIHIAQQALRELAAEAGHASECCYLEELESMVAAGTSPADLTLRWAAATQPTREQLLDHYTRPWPINFAGRITAACA